MSTFAQSSPRSVNPLVRALRDAFPQHILLKEVGAYLFDQNLAGCGGSLDGMCDCIEDPLIALMANADDDLHAEVAHGSGDGEVIKPR